jgi:hypothetical protein
LDDFFATGHTTAELESHLTTLGTIASSARIPFGNHPDTGDKLCLPAGYDVQFQTIVRLDRQGTPQRVYSTVLELKQHRAL